MKNSRKGSQNMRKSMMAILLAGTISLSACATDSRQAGDIAQGAAIGAAVGGLAGAVWADNNNDGYADGYVQNGTYYTGTPQGYDPTLRRVATGALGGAALGAVAGAVIPGLSIVEGAVVGAAIGGLAGAVWADNDRDGRVDGYVYNGQNYQGTPQGYAPTSAPPPMSGERG
jgi:hypothetical protein